MVRAQRRDQVVAARKHANAPGGGLLAGRDLAHCVRAVLGVVIGFLLTSLRYVLLPLRPCDGCKRPH